MTMMQPQTLAATQVARETFYPTPVELANMMLEKIKDWHMIETVLEPSAGKGDLAEAIARKLESAHYWRRNDRKEHLKHIDCIEVDPNLRAILKDKGFRVVHDDFLTLQTYKRYSAIIMNPPFDKGAEHLLKAIDLMKDCGGEIVCLLNAETILNPYSYTRQELIRNIVAFEGDVTQCGEAFTDAQRKTHVNISLVHLNVPAPEKRSTLFDEMRREEAARKEDSPVDANKALIKGDYIEALVDRYNFELSCGIRMIDEWSAMKHLLYDELDKESHLSSPIMGLMIGGESYRGGKQACANLYVNEMRKKYWNALFNQPQFVSQLTSNLQKNLFSMVEEMIDYDFSYYNIYTLAQNLLMQVNSGIEQTIMQLFDNWTRKWHYDENSQNRHYFDGWCTNDAFAVNKKVIIPFYGAFDSWSGKITEYNVTSKIADIEKVFNYLDGGASIDIDSTSAIKEACASGQTKNIQCRYFTATFYKKGTCHIQFTNLDVLHKFNLFAAKGKNWLPPSYGKKRYKDMTEEEKAVIDSFEGEKSYENVLAHRDYFLQTAQPMLLGAGA